MKFYRMTLLVISEMGKMRERERVCFDGVGTYSVVQNESERATEVKERG